MDNPQKIPEELFRAADETFEELKKTILPYLKTQLQRHPQVEDQIRYLESLFIITRAINGIIGDLGTALTLQHDLSYSLNTPETIDLQKARKRVVALKERVHEIRLAFRLLGQG